MIWWVFGAVVAVVWTVYGFPAAVLAALAMGIPIGWYRARVWGPQPRAPKPPKQHHWGLGFGLAISTHGPFPFITVYRRRY